MQFLVPDMQLYTLRCWSVDWYVGHIFEFLVFFASLLLPNHPRLDCRVSGLVCKNKARCKARQSQTVGQKQ